MDKISLLPITKAAGGCVLLLMLLAGCSTLPAPQKVMETIPIGEPVQPPAPLNLGEIYGRVELDGSWIDGLAPIAEPIVAGLQFVVLIRTHPAARPLTGNDLAGAGLTKNQMLTLAKTNLAAGLRPMAEVGTILSSGQIGTIRGDQDEAARLVLHDDWASLAARFNNHLIVAAPALDIVLYTDGSSPSAIGDLQKLARSLRASSPHKLTDAVFGWTTRGWDIVSR